MVEASEAFATRVSAEEAERIEAALEQTDQSQSDFVGTALRYYLQENPEDIPALCTESENQGPTGEPDIYDPTVEESIFDD